ncbi:MAG: ABC transporter permease [Microgenomates group bacterium GW2011_GWB1_44_8]|nr:MAG: ABC transporter permease [Microgenomates group bacterium GW2011_GWB1_44_8]
MVSIARKNLFAEKPRFLVTSLGVAFSVLLILFLLGIYTAFSNMATSYLKSTGADIIVAQKGAKSMTHTFSILDKNKIGLVESISGGEAYGLVARTTNVLVTEEDGTKIVDFPGRKKGENIKGKKAQVSIIGFDINSYIGGPKVILAGAASPGDGEIIVDKVFARQNDLWIGDQIEVFDKVLTISGITEKQNVLIYSRGFMELSEAKEIFRDRNSVNFILVKLADPSQAKTIADRLDKQIDGISAYETNEFAKMNGEEITNNFLPIILVITIIGFLTGAVVVGLTIYTSTLEKIREYGVLKAIGATNKQLFFIVLEQALWFCGVGLIAGLFLTWIVTSVATEVVPVIMAEYNLSIYMIVVALTLLMSILASFVPIKRISGIDPATIFKS